MSTAFRRDEILPAGLAGRIDPVCDRFESDWLAGGRPRLEDFLPQVEQADRTALLRELLALELDYRRRNGEEPAAEEYCLRIPEHAEIIDAAFVSISTIVHESTSTPEVERAAPSVPAAATVRLPGYEILHELGRGGMGVVYKARHLKLDRVVALKMILAGGHAGLADLARFKIEVEAIARLQHPNIVQIFEVGEHGGRSFFSLEFCAGGSLNGKLAGTPTPPMAAAALVEKLAWAMQAAHDKDVIHRDLKPANVLLAEDGTPKVTDFGLAKKLDEAGETETGAVMGTPCYMAPEQASGKSKEVGPQADLYALGAILYECLTGRPPFKAPTPLETLQQVIADDPVAPRQLQSKTPRDLETICLKCLEKQSGRRYATAQELAEDLRRFQAGEPITARPVGRWERVVRWVKRRPGAAAFLALLSLLITVVLIGMKAYADERSAAAAEKENAAKQTKSSLYRALLGQAITVRLAREQGYRRHVWDLLHQAQALDVPDKQSDDIRKEVLACLGDPLGIEPTPFPKTLRMTSLPLPEQCADLMRALGVVPSGEKPYAVTADGEMIAVCTAQNGSEVALFGRSAGLPASTTLKLLAKATPGLGVIHSLQFTPDGQFLVVGCEEGTVVWSVPGLTLHTFTRGGVVSRIAVHRFGHLMATTSWQQGRAEVWSLHSNRLVASIEMPPGASWFDFSADGKFLLAISPAGENLFGWPIDATPEKRYLAGHEAGVPGVAFSPDGRRLASVSKDRTLKVWDLESGALLHTCTGHRAAIQTVAFSPDGTLLATGDWGDEVRIWDSSSGKERALLAAPGTFGGIWRLQFDPDGRHLAVAGSTGLAVLEVHADAEAIGLKEVSAVPALGVIDLVIHPNGRHLAALDRDGRIAIYDMPNPTKPRFLPVLGSPNPLTLSFDSTGDHIRFMRLTNDLGIVDWRDGAAESPKSLPNCVPTVACSPGDRWAVFQNQSHQLVFTDLLNKLQDLPALPPETGGVWAVTWSPDGRRVAAGLPDGSIVVWDLEEVRARLKEFDIDMPTMRTGKAHF